MRPPKRCGPWAENLWLRVKQMHKSKGGFKQQGEKLWLAPDIQNGGGGKGHMNGGEETGEVKCQTNRQQRHLLPNVSCK